MSDLTHTYTTCHSPVLILSSFVTSINRRLKPQALASGYGLRLAQGIPYADTASLSLSLCSQAEARASNLVFALCTPIHPPARAQVELGSQSQLGVG